MLNKLAYLKYTTDGDLRARLSSTVDYGCGGGGGIQNKGRNPQQLSNFSDFGKKSNFNTIWNTFYTFLKSFERIKLPRPFSSHLLTGQVRNTFKRLYFRLNFLSNLGKGVWGELKPPSLLSCATGTLNDVVNGLVEQIVEF